MAHQVRFRVPATVVNAPWTRLRNVQYCTSRLPGILNSDNAVESCVKLDWEQLSCNVKQIEETLHLRSDLSDKMARDRPWRL